MTERQETTMTPERKKEILHEAAENDPGIPRSYWLDVVAELLAALDEAEAAKIDLLEEKKRYREACREYSRQLSSAREVVEAAREIAPNPPTPYYLKFAEALKRYDEGAVTSYPTA